MTPIPHIEPSRPLRALRRLLAAWTSMRARRAAARELQGMSEHELKDLGIGRSEIPSRLACRPGTPAAENCERSTLRARLAGLDVSGA